MCFPNRSIIGFSLTKPMRSDHAWNEKLYAAWDLAKPPPTVKWSKPGYIHWNMDKWGLYTGLGETAYYGN